LQQEEGRSDMRPIVINLPGVIASLNGTVKEGGAKKGPGDGTKGGGKGRGRFDSGETRKHLPRRFSLVVIRDKKKERMRENKKIGSQNKEETNRILGE